jgi:signal transduction histidine kinase
VRIATRLSILFVSLTLVVALTVGWFAVSMSSRARLETLDSAINAVVDSGLRDPNTALSNALYVVQYNNYDLTLDVVYPSGSISRVSTASVPLTRRPTLADVKSSLHEVETEPNLPGFRIRSVYVGGGDYLVVAGSTAGITKQNQHQELLVASAAVVIALLGFALARIVMRRDLHAMSRLISYAGDVASGDEAGPVPPSEGSRDLRELREALAVMVDALRERIEFEAQNAKAMQQFIDDASHELRTPLTVVKGYNDLLLGGATSPEQHERALVRVRREVERMELLVRDLLLLAQVREMPHHAAAPVPLSELVEARAAEFRQEHPSHPLASAVAPGLTLHARADFVERFMTNALNNVARHTPPDAPVRVTLRAVDGRAELTVEDGGPGLPHYGARPQRFQRFDESRSRETGGSGLGMSIMADIAEALGGTMTTERSDLGGLCVRVTLPLVAGRPSG